MRGGVPRRLRACSGLAMMAGALLAPAAWAADEPPAPCPTPCLAVPAAKPEAPARAEAPARPETRPAAKGRTAPARPAAPPVAAHPAKPPLSRRCADIMMRAQLGEPVSDRDMEHLRNEC